jgi:hypothetical protein
LALQGNFLGEAFGIWLNSDYFRRERNALKLCWSAISVATAQEIMTAIGVG